MSAPINTYDSNTKLSLGNVPDIEDPRIYEALLDIHNALEAILSASDDGDAIAAAFIAKFRAYSSPAVTSDYTVLPTDGTVRVDASSGPVTVTLPAVAAIPGYRFDIKRIDSAPANAVVLQGDGAELVDGRAGGIRISTKSSYTVKAHDTGWDII